MVFLRWAHPLWLPVLLMVVLTCSCGGPPGAKSGDTEHRGEDFLPGDSASGRGALSATRGRVVNAAANMTVARAAHTATPLPGGNVLLAGGCTLEGCEMAENSATAELYDPLARSFVKTGSMVTGRVSHTATLLPDGKVLVAGGWNSDQVLGAAEVYDPATGAFSPAGNMATPRAAHTATPLPDGKILVTGGFDGERSVAAAEVYDPLTRGFEPVDEMKTARSAHAAALLKDGRVLITGGSDSREKVVASAEIYDPHTGRFVGTGNLTVPRYKHATVALEDGKVLVDGGSNADDFYGQRASAELFDPETNAFASISGMDAERFKLPDAVAVLDGGEVLVGGDGGHAEVYGPRTSGFHVIPGNMGTARMFATTTPLTDGRALIAGGYDENIDPTGKTWLYLPED